jgi:hypothetical protein
LASSRLRHLSVVALNGRIHPVAQLVHPFRQVEGSHARNAWIVRGLALVSLVNPRGLFRDTSAGSTLAPHRLRARVGSRSRRMPRESRNVPEDLPKERRCQVALGQLEDEVPGKADEATAGLEQPLLEAREGPAASGRTSRRSRLPRL